MKTFAFQVLSYVLLAVLLPLEANAIEPNRANAQAKLSPSGANFSSSRALGDAPMNLAPGVTAPGIRNRTAPAPNAAPPTANAPAVAGIDPSLSEYWVPIPDPVAQTTELQKWRLGIYPENTDTGVRIGEVIRGSAAERGGLEVNDRIVSIGGYQVGYVNGTLYDVGAEFERHADRNGWVRILVQNNRDGNLMNMPLQLESRNESITGSITYRDRSALPRDAVATVELREVLRADLQPITIGRQTISPVSSVPISFSMEYDPSEIDSRRSYVIDANITSGGRQIYAMRQSAPIFNGRSHKDVQLLVESTARVTSPGLDRNSQLDQIALWFREYLRREPRSQELYVWESHLARGGSLSDVQLQILSTPEFYYQSDANDETYIRRMFQLVVGRQPSRQEVYDWNRRLQDYNRMRPELAREFLEMAGAQASSSVRR